MKVAADSKNSAGVSVSTITGIVTAYEANARAIRNMYNGGTSTANGRVQAVGGAELIVACPVTIGKLETRNTASNGVVDSDDHNMVTGDVAGIMVWPALVPTRTGMDVTIAGDNVTLDGGTGDDLPSLNSTVHLLCNKYNCTVAVTEVFGPSNMVDVTQCDLTIGNATAPTRRAV